MSSTRQEKKKEGVRWGERDAELQESVVRAQRLPILFIIIGVAIAIIVIWLLLGV